MSSIRNYLVWEPKGKLARIVDTLDSLLKSRSDELYRGMSAKEFESLKSEGRVTSAGKGNTRDVVGSYLASDVSLAGRFAVVNYRDHGNGIILVIDKSKLPDVKMADPGNFITSSIPIEAVKRVIDLSKLKLMEHKAGGIEYCVRAVMLTEEPTAEPFDAFDDVYLANHRDEIEALANAQADTTSTSPDSSWLADNMGVKAEVANEIFQFWDMHRNQLQDRLGGK